MREADRTFATSAGSVGPDGVLVERTALVHVGTGGRSLAGGAHVVPTIPRDRPVIGGPRPGRLARRPRPAPGAAAGPRVAPGRGRWRAGGGLRRWGGGWGVRAGAARRRWCPRAGGPKPRGRVPRRSRGAPAGRESDERACRGYGP